MRHEKLRHLPQFTTLMEEIRKRNLESYTIEERLAGLDPEERLAGLDPEERLAGLDPEEMLAGLSQSQRERLKKLLESQS